MLKLRGYAIYSFEYLEIKMVFKIVNAITTGYCGLKCSHFWGNGGQVVIFSGASGMKRLITF